MLKKIFITGLVVCFLSIGLSAGGWNNTLMGIRAIAMGAAFTGIADDASAVFYNPAGMVQQENKINLSINGFYVTPIYEYTLPTGGTAESRFSNGLPQIFFTYKSSDRVTFGFGAYIPYAGGGVDWKENDLGFPLKSTMGIFSLTPSVAFKISEMLSVGFNLNYYQGVLSVQTVMAPFGRMEGEENGSTLSASFGALYQPAERLRFGLSVRGPARLTLRGKTSIFMDVPGFGAIKFNLDSETAFNLPWDFELGVSYQLSERILVSASAQYSMWSVLDKIEKTIKKVPEMGDLKVDEVMNFNDIFITRIGMEYVLPGGIFLRGGIGMDQYASPTETLGVTNIDVDKFTLLGGIGYRTGNLQFDVVYVHAQGKEREKISTLFGFPITERYNLSARIFGMGITFSF